MTGWFSWIRERLSPEVTPATRRKRSNAWLGNDGDERPDNETSAATGTSSSATAGAASGNAEVGARRAALAAPGSPDTRPSKVPRQGLGAGNAHVQLGFEQDGAATRPLLPPRTTSTPAQFSLSPRAAAPDARHGSSGVSVSATPGVGGLRAVAGGMMSVTPRTPVRRWTHEGAAAASVGAGTRSVTRGEGMGVGTGAGRGGGSGGGATVAATAVPSGYTYGRAVLPQSTPRRLIMATAHSSRVRPTATTTSTGTGAWRTGSAGGGRHGAGPGYASGYGSGFGNGGRTRTFGGSGSALRHAVTSTTTTNTGSGDIGAFGGRGFGSSSSSNRINIQRTSGDGFERGGRGRGSGNSASRGPGDRLVFKSAAARAKKYAAYLEQYGRRPAKKSKRRASPWRRSAGVTAVRAAADGDAVLGAAHARDHQSGSSHEIMAVKSLNNLRTKARKNLERQALDIQARNPEGAELLRKDARHIENWGREAAEGARREAEANARRLSEALALKEAEQAAALKKAEAEAAAAAAAEARALARQKEEAEAEAELARVRAQEEEEARLKAEEEEEARLAAAAAAAAAQEQERLELSPEQEEQVAAVWISPVGGADDHEVVVQAYNDMVSKGSMRTLCHGEWLGDEVINLYMKSIQARNRVAVASGQQVPKCGMMSTFFYTQLSDDGRGYRYQGVKRFLKKAKIDLFDLDKFMFPVNVNRNHWTLAVINFRLRRLEYYDSMGQPFDPLGFEYMARFVNDESKSKRGGQEMDISDWPTFNYANLPRQNNCVDCGVFASMFADRLSKGRPLSFTQDDIRLFRQVMTLVILRGERAPTEEEAFLEDGGTVPSDAPAWWDPPEEDPDDDNDAEDIDDDDEAEDDGEWDSGEHEEVEEADQGAGGEAGGGDGGGDGGGGGQKLNRAFDGWAREAGGIEANGFGLAAEGALHEEQARHSGDLSSKSNGPWPTFPGEQSNGGGGAPVWAGTFE
eukprot:g16418.t1